MHSRFARIALLGKSLGKTLMGGGKIWLDMYCFPEVDNCFFNVALGGNHASQIEVSFRELWINSQGLVKLPLRLVELSLRDQSVGKIKMRHALLRLEFQ